MQFSHRALVLLFYSFDGEMEWFKVVNNGI